MKAKTKRNLVLGLAATMLLALVVHAQTLVPCATFYNKIYNTLCQCIIGTGGTFCEATVIFNPSLGTDEGSICTVYPNHPQDMQDVQVYTYINWIFYYQGDACDPDAPCCGCPLVYADYDWSNSWCTSQEDPNCITGS